MRLLVAVRSRVLLDGWQVVPEVLGAVKRAVEEDPRPGRYVITGSVRGDVDEPGWPGTGRLVRIAMFGMTVREQVGSIDGAAFLDAVARGDPPVAPADSPDLRGYIEIALRGGFPEPALRLSAPARESWLESYVDQMLTRDAQEVDGGRDPMRLRRYFEAYALNSAGVADDKTIYDAAGINRRTAIAYERLLRNLLVVEAVPAWTSNRLKRLSLASKRYVVDSALVGASLRLDATEVLRDGNLLGRLLDTFVVSQLRAELPVTASRPRLYHLRQEQGRHEVDLIAELGARGVVGIEVKATAAPGADDARHLAWFRDWVGDAFVAGIVFHTGGRVFRLGERLIAAPISTLWAGP